MKNYQTPRNLADCEFTVGHQATHRRAVQRSGQIADRLVLLVFVFTIGLLTGMGVL